MKKTLQYILCLVLTLAITSCGGSAPAGDVNSSVETVVAATLQSLTQAPAPTQTLSLLPRSLYFTKNDGAGLKQVFRLEKDGVTVTQLTFEPANVEDYDISQVDGSIVYDSNNQLFTVNADGSNRSMIFDGGQIDENNAFLNTIRSPVWSPDGQTIAFGHGGLSFYSIAGGQSNRVLADQIDDLDGGLKIPREMYWPEAYSADGSKLVITLGYYEGASAAIYYINGGALVRLNSDAGAFICCGMAKFSPDGSSLYSAYSFLGGMYRSGLWKVDTASGDVVTLIDTGYGDTSPIEFASNPYLAPDGQLYFFYGSLQTVDDFSSNPPLQMARSGPDGVTGRTILRPEIFETMNEVLWAPDGSFAIVAVPDLPEIYEGGKAQMYAVDGQPMVSLLPYAYQMKWGP